MEWIGVNQSGSISETLEVAKKYLVKGHDIRLCRVDFGEDSREHKAIEYEVHVFM